MTVDNKFPSPETELAARIVRLKKEKGAVILAHYYTLPEVQEVADFLGPDRCADHPVRRRALYGRDR